MDKKLPYDKPTPMRVHPIDGLLYEEEGWFPAQYMLVPIEQYEEMKRKLEELEKQK